MIHRALFMMWLGALGAVASIDLVCQDADSTNNVVPVPKKAIECLYPDMPREQWKPQFTPGPVLTYCGDFSPSLTAPPNNGLANQIGAAFALDRLDFDNVHERISVTGLLYMQWNVTTCTQITEDKNAVIPKTRLVVPSKDDVWRPKYLFTSSASDIFMSSNSAFGDDLVATLEKPTPVSNATITFYQTRRGFFVSDCSPITLDRFPFDHQQCDFTFALQNGEDQVTFSDSVKVACPVNETSEWQFLGCSFARKTTKLQGVTVSQLIFTAKIQRTPVYYLVHLAIPSMVLSLLELATFLMSPRFLDRPIFAVTILLALTVAQSQVLSGLPHTWRTILLIEYIQLLTWFSTACTFYELLASFVFYYNNGDNTANKPSSPGAKLSTIQKMDIAAFSLSLAVFIALNAYAISRAF